MATEAATQTYPWQTGQHAEFIAAQRGVLSARRAELNAHIKTCQTELKAVDIAMNQIGQFESAMIGKAPRTGSGASSGATRTRKGSRREELWNLIRTSDGLSRGDILERMGLKGDKSGEMSVSNAFTALIKRNQIRRDGGKYFAVETVTQGALAA